MIIKNIKRLKRRIIKCVQIIFNIALVVAIVFLFIQNNHLKKELQCSKANEFKLFETVNKQADDIFNLKANIVSITKIVEEQDIKNKKSQKK